jgi:hypothetical protein
MLIIISVKTLFRVFGRGRVVPAKRAKIEIFVEKISSLLSLTQNNNNTCNATSNPKQLYPINTAAKRSAEQHIDHLFSLSSQCQRPI